jgi:hypothetical protein
MKKCKVKGCCSKILAKEYCNKHYWQMFRHGKILKRTRFDKNEIINCNDYCKIVVYSGRGEQHIIGAIKIDKNCLLKVKKYKWCLRKGYPFSANKKINLTTLIMGYRPGFEIDHINHNILDNRKRNLRFVTQSQNNMNRKGVLGYRNYFSLFEPRIKINKKEIYLGRFKNKNQAIRARKKAEKIYFKEYAYLNK